MTQAWRIDMVLTRVLALALGAIGLVALPADATGVLECTSRGIWRFDQPLTPTTTSGYVELEGTNVCLRYTVGTGFTTDAYTARVTFGYSGNCQRMTLSSGLITGVMLGEQTIAYHSPGTGTPGVHVVMTHPTCAGATTLSTVYHWAAVLP